MSDDELRDEMVTVLGAGHETTATALAWAIERLLRNPEVLAGCASRSPPARAITSRRRCEETLRSRPVMIDVGRKLTAPATVGGYELPRRTFVLPAIAAIHYREDLYPRAQRVPARALPREGKADNYAWIPFGGGVRRCIGAAFAEYEMRTILREIVSRADLRRRPTRRPERVKVRNITLGPGKGDRGHARAAAGRRRGCGLLGARLSGLPLGVELGDRRFGGVVALCRPARAARARPGGGVGELLLERRQLGLGLARSAPPASAALRAAFCGRLLRPAAALAACRAAVPLAAAVRRLGRLPRVRRGGAGTRPSRSGGWSARRPRRRGCGCRPPPAAPGRGRSAGSRPRTRCSASSSASRLSMSRWLVGSSRTRTLAPEATRIASESRRCSPPEMSESCFSTSPPEKRKPPSRARAFGPLRPVSRWAASSTVPSPAAVSACWER